MFNLEEVPGLIARLDSIHEEKLRVRRELFRFVRKFYDLSSFNDGWLKRKIDRRYLGDLNDVQLIDSVRRVYEGLPEPVDY